MATRATTALNDSSVLSQSPQLRGHGQSVSDSAWHLQVWESPVKGQPVGEGQEHGGAVRCACSRCTLRAVVGAAAWRRAAQVSGGSPSGRDHCIPAKKASWSAMKSGPQSNGGHVAAAVLTMSAMLVDIVESIMIVSRKSRHCSCIGSKACSAPDRGLLSHAQSGPAFHQCV